MKKLAMAMLVALAGSAWAAPDWSKVAPRKVTLFYPGQASLEWVMNKPDHSAVPDIVDKKRSCAKCHEGDANEIGDKIVKGMAGIGIEEERVIGGSVAVEVVVVDQVEDHVRIGEFRG